MRWLSLVLLVAAAAPSQGRLVVIGVDGMDHALTKRWMDAGELPALAALAGRGTFEPLLPSNPAQSPTSWASMMTGTNPGGHGIFGFLRRSIVDGEVIPEMSMAEKTEKPMLTSGLRTLGYLAAFLIGLLPLWFLRKRRRMSLVIACSLSALLLLTARWFFANLPESITVPINLRSKTALWESLDLDGVPTRTLGAPCAFPAPDLEHGHLLCGLGVPDLQGTPGSWVLWRAGPVQDGSRVTQMGGRELTLHRPGGSDRIDGMRLLGPSNPLDQKRLSIDVPLRVVGETVVADIQGREVVLEVGKFSDHQEVRFHWGELGGAVVGLVRLRLLQVQPHVAIYQEPVQFHPAHQIPYAPLTSPMTFGLELFEVTPFETVGWAVSTNPYQDELIDDATILEDARALAAGRAAMTLDQARRDDWRVLVSVLSTPDRLQHVFWSDLEPDHPGHDAAGAARRGNVILESYKAIDRLIETLQKDVLREDDTLLVVSDHGFAPFRRAVNLNRFLAEEGWLSANPDGARSLDQHLGKAAFSHLDWSKTKAYAMGLGRIWLNLEGREPQGCVKPDEADALIERIRTRLLALRDTDGSKVVRSVERASDIYSGARVAEASDLVVGFERGYRISWNSCLGGVDEEVIFENRTRWSGDHCSVDPSLVPGVLFCSRRLSPASSVARVADVFPTVRALLGLSVPDGLDGRDLTRPR